MNNQKYYVLGLDISTTCTGWALLELETGDLAKYGKIITADEENIFEQARKIQKDLYKETMGFAVVVVGVEQLNSFRNGSITRALCGISYIVQDYIYKYWGIFPNQINTGTAKSVFTRGYKTWKGAAKKPDVLAVANARYGLNLKFIAPNKKKGGNGDDDISDATSIAFALREEVGEDLLSQIKEKK